MNLRGSHASNYYVAFVSWCSTALTIYSNPLTMKEIQMRKYVMPLAVLALVCTGAVAGTKTVGGIEVRDWAAIDKDRDHLVSPQEMEQYLKDQWQKGKQASKR